MNDTQSPQLILQKTPPAGRYVVEPLHDEFATWQALYEAQPGLVQRYIEAQARLVAEAISRGSPSAQFKFSLPDRVVVTAPAGRPGQVGILPEESREQLVGGLMDRLTRTHVAQTVRQRLCELEQSPHRAVAVGAGLVRFATAEHLVRQLLPSGHTVEYVAEPGEEIPSRPVVAALEPGSAITAANDAVAEEPGAAEEVQGEAGRGELQVPFVPAARRFYLPQWVAFDADGHLLVGSMAEAEAHVGSMQRFLAILHMAISLAPYIVSDEAYQQKRYGMLGQLVNQGRALARYRTSEIVQTIWRRAKAQDLNRGLSVSLPYFDDQDLRLRLHAFEVIPAGRIMFVPAYVVHASIAEQAKVSQDTRLSISTRQHLLTELRLLEAAFALPEGE